MNELTVEQKRRIEWRRDTLMAFMTMIIGEAEQKGIYNPNAAQIAQQYVQQLEEVIDQDPEKYFWLPPVEE